MIRLCFLSGVALGGSLFDVVWSCSDSPDAALLLQLHAAGGALSAQSQQHAGGQGSTLLIFPLIPAELQVRPSHPEHVLSLKSWSGFGTPLCMIIKNDLRDLMFALCCK